MSISGALSNALSGLTASSRNAQVVASNLANVLTPGYGPRSLELASRGDARMGGVSVAGLTRQVDAGLLSDRRAADSALANAGAKADFFNALERITGTVDAPGSLFSRLSEFEAALVTAAAKPEESSRLRAAVMRAEDLAGAFNHASRQIQALRTDAEAKIGQAVREVNAQLSNIETLNAQILDARNAGHPTAGFEDQRQVAIDQLAEYMPVRLMTRENGSLAIYSTGGAALLDGRASELSFTSSNVIEPHMTIEADLLDRLRINGQEVQVSGDRSAIAGGRLAGLFELRDVLATDAQAQLDAISRDLVSRFQDAGLDATRAPGAAGVFTDAGSAFDTAEETGLSGRLSVNSALLPEEGGAHWRLRDGLGATAPGPAGDAALLQDLSAALSAPASLASGDLGATARSAADHLSTLLSRFGQDRLSLDQSVAFATSRQASLAQLELSQGVDSDAEMQKLLLIEQAYSANARMIEVIDEMIERLLRI